MDMGILLRMISCSHQLMSIQAERCSFSLLLRRFMSVLVMRAEWHRIHLALWPP